MEKEQKAIATLDFGTLDEEKYLVNFGQYEIFFENGETYFVKKKPAYPTTYGECRKIMCAELWNTLWGEDATEYEKQTEDLINALIKLKVCRDAYWKVVGEKMGLGKPWEPDWKHGKDKFYCICTTEDEIVLGEWYIDNKILAFPTAEMRDAFYENFKHLIEECKEFL